MKDNIWKRADGSVRGTWSEDSSQLYFNFNKPELDDTTTDIFRGFWVFKKVKQTEWVM